MTAWGVLLGALGAGLVAWLAIALIAWAGRARLRPAPLRLFGAAALGLLALRVAGVPVPWIAPPGLLGLGLVAGLVPPVWREGRE